jgi:hypothetical protein
MDQREHGILIARYNDLFESMLNSTLKMREVQLRTRMCEDVTDETLVRLETEIDDAMVQLSHKVVEAKKRLNSLKPTE